MERFGRYLLLERLGRGGMGEVHLARRDGADHPCVLKLLRVEHRGNSSLLSRLKREAHLLSYLDHPNVARILDAGVEDGVFYLALEHIDGHTLRSVMKRCSERGRPMPAGAAIAIALAVLEGLAKAHALVGPAGEPLHVVHRDLSPNNVMISARGEVKIIDFGLASAKVDHFQTTPGIVLGTLRYAAPEQAETGQVDRRSDLYTAGAVLYEALTGHPLVETREPNAILQAVTDAEPRPFREAAPHLSDALEAVVRASLAHDPNLRPQHAAIFSERLKAAAADLEVFTPARLAEMIAELDPYSDTAATLTGAETTASETTASEPSGTVEIAPRPRRPRRLRLTIPWIAALLLCGAVLALSFAAVRAALDRQAMAERRR